MCLVIPTTETKSPSSGLGAEITGDRLAAGVPTRLGAGSMILNKHFHIHAKCLHPDGREDEYHLNPGESLHVDEAAVITLLNIPEIRAEMEQRKAAKDLAGDVASADS